MKARIDRLKDLERMESSGAIAMRPKKEGAVLRRRARSSAEIPRRFEEHAPSSMWWFLWTNVVKPTLCPRRAS